MTDLAFEVEPQPMRQRLLYRKQNNASLALASNCAQLLLWVLLASLPPASAQVTNNSSRSGETFTISGSVVNSVTGEPIPHALVRTNGYLQRSVFSDSEGRFQMDGVPAGRVNLTAQKPGFVNQQDMSVYSPEWVNVGPSTPSVSVKLLPQSAIFGRVTDAAGQPLEHMPLRMTCQNIRDGRKRWESRGMTETDEDGHFRFSNLLPGTYYLNVGPSFMENRLSAVSETPKIGYPSEYYPGVPDLSAASPLQLAAGAQMEADFSLSAVPLYTVTGSVAGHIGEQGVGFQVFNQSGDEISLPTTYNMGAGTFRMESVPAGSYIVRAVSQVGAQTLRAETRLSVASNLDNVRMLLGPATSIPISVRMDSRDSSNTTSTTLQRPPVSVRLLPTDAAGTESYSSYQVRGPGQDAMVLQNVDPGTYTVDVMPQAPWYAQSATYGQTNLLYDNLFLTNSGQSYPIEIVLRNDGASLTGTVKASDDTGVQATVIIAPQPTSKVAPKAVQTTGSFTASGLAPGEYLVYAFDHTTGMEYSNPDVLATYSSQAAQVTLSAGQQAQVSVDLIHVGKGE